MAMADAQFFFSLVVVIAIVMAIVMKLLKFESNGGCIVGIGGCFVIGVGA